MQNKRQKFTNSESKIFGMDKRFHLDNPSKWPSFKDFNVLYIYIFYYFLRLKCKRKNIVIHTEIEYIIIIKIKGEEINSNTNNNEDNYIHIMF